MKDIKYFNAPIELLSGFLIDSSKCLNDFIDYHLYNHSLKLEGDTPFSDAAKFYGVQFYGNGENEAHENGEALYNSIPTNTPKVGIRIDLFWQFLKEDKTDFEKACFLAFLALKSIVGSKPYCNVRNKFFLARMDGKAKAITDKSELSEEIQKYSNDYQLRKIKNELKLNWGLVHVSYYIRGFNVSFKLSLKELNKVTESTRIKIKLKKQKRLEKEAREEALRELENENRSKNISR